MRLRRMAIATLTAGLLAAVTISAQIPGSNVNMVSGTGWPGGDPFLQRQNEPSIATSTRNPLHLMGGANDYRTIDLPGIGETEETRDAWLGLFKSFDGGQRWMSTLLPGYPQDPTAEGQASPIHGYQAGADPVVRAGTSGMLYYNGLVFDRVENGKSAIFVARFIDNNNKEAGDPIKYIGTSLVASVPAGGGRFLDKPWLVVDIPRGGASRCTIVTPSPQGNVTQRIPAGTAYVAYTSITGSGLMTRSEILLSRSTDCGATWSTPVRVSRPEDPVNQGATIAIDPRNGNVFVAWRRFGLTNPEADAIVVARSLNQGRRFEPPGLLKRLAHLIAQLQQKPRTPPQLLQLLERLFEHRFVGTVKDADTNLAEFDQTTSELDIRFRSNAYPTTAFDGNGRLYIAWSERGYASMLPSPIDGDTRIVLTTTTNGITFTPTMAVDDTQQLGHQIMPSLAFAGGKLMLIYYDLRETRSNLFGKWIDDKSASVSGKRHTIDIRAALGTPGATPAFAPSVKVSQYLRGMRTVNGVVEDLQVNPPNLPMFRQGTVPFIGDYIDVTPAPAFVPLGNGQWAYNTETTATLPVFHAVWTDNRDVRPPLDLNWKNYTPPPFSGPSPSGSTVPQCLAGNAGSRNQNVYTARLTGGLIVGSPGNDKTLSTTLQRGFVVFAQNTTTQTRIFSFTIASQPPGGRASFSQFPLPPYNAASPAPVLRVDAIVPPRSTVSRTVYVTSSSPSAQINVNIAEIASLGAPPAANGLTGHVIINPDIDTPDIDTPDIDTPGVPTPDIDTSEVATPDIDTPDIDTPDIDTLAYITPDIDTPDIDSILVANPDIDTLGVATPDIDTPDIDAFELANQEIGTPDIDTSSLTDITWRMRNPGNTTAAFNINLFLTQQNLPPGLKVQLILRKVYTTPVVKDCTLKVETRNILVANIPNPAFLHPNDPQLPILNDPSDKNATIWLAPGESGFITLRVVDADTSNNILVDADGAGPAPPVSIDPALDPTTNVTPVIRSQPVPSEEAQAGKVTPPLVTPTGANVLFAQPPVHAVAGASMFPPVAVQVRDGGGNVIPNATVTLEFNDNPTGAVLSGNGGQISNGQGLAVFPNLQIDRTGFGYSLKATATGTVLGQPFTGTGLTNAFAVTESCVAAGAATLQRYHVDGPAWPDRPKLIKGGVDWNQDGLEDVVVVSNGGVFYTMPNIAGGFSAGYLFASPTGLSGAADVATGDFNGDGAPDVAVAKGSTQNTVVFQPLALGVPSGPQVVTSVEDPAIRLATGDFNNDTRLDLAVLRAASVRILWGDATGNFPSTFDDLPGLTLATAIATLDLDNDDDLDLVVADSTSPTGGIRVFRNHPTGVFTAMAAKNVGNTPMHLAVKDFNGDGYPDIAVAHAVPTDVTVLFGDAAGDYAVSTVVPLGFVPGGLTAGDYNTDGVADLAVTHTTAHALTIWFGRHGTPFTFADPRTFLTDPQPIGITTGDFNNDGRADLATANGSAGSVDDFNTISVLLGTCGAQTADVAVTQTESADPVAHSSPLKYTATVTNHGPFTATNVSVVHQATSPGLNLIWDAGFGSSQGTCERGSGGQGVVCDLGSLAPGASATVTSPLHASSGVGSISSVFVATATEVDLAPDNNRDVETTTVNEPAYIVTTPADAGPGSLRQAILDANADPGPDTILFNLPNAPPHTITPLSALPAITDALLIDAPVTGDCAGAPPTIEIDGVSAGSADGLVAAAPGVTIRGLAVTRFSRLGIVLSGGGGVVECSYLGLAPDGITAKGNGLGGILVTGSGNTIGGASAAVRNVISGNVGYGIRIAGPGGNVVQGNFIGTNAAGTAARANGDGIEVRAANNTIGGLTAVPGASVGNVISGNAQDGIQVVAPGAIATTIIQGNIIGLGADGVTPLGNTTGVRLSNSAAQIGGTATEARNVISGNDIGITLSNSGSTRNTFIEGNYIGTDITGTLKRANSIGVSVGSAPGTRVGGTAVDAGNVISGNQTGVLIYAISHPVIDGKYNALVQGNLIGVQADGTTALGNGTAVRIHNDNNLIGGTDPGAGNTLAFSTASAVGFGAGVEVRFATSTRILSNSIFGNVSLGIDLEEDGPTANDPDDVDGGANLGQNYPVITSATVSGGSGSITGSLRSTADTIFTIQVFANNTGEAQGRRLLGTLSQKTDTDGYLLFTLAPAIALGEVITATATDPAGNTSEFSPGVTTAAADPVPVSLDTTAFSNSPVYVVNESGGAQVAIRSAGDVANVMLVPGSHTFRIPFASTTAAFDFLVANNGTIDYSPVLDGIVSGRGTQVLIVLGRTLTVDTTALQPKPPGWLASGLLVSSFGSNHVLRYNGQTGAFADTLVDSEELDGPGGLAYGADGKLYVVSQTNHSVVRADGDAPGGASPFVASGSGGLSFPTGLTFGPDGHLYVASGNDRILKYNGQTGAFISEFVPNGSGGLDRPADLKFGPDGHLYVSSYFTHNVLRYNGSTGAFMGVFATGNGLNLPNGLAFGPDGHLYVASTNDSVLRYHGSSGAFIDAFVPVASGGLNNPIGVTFGPDGRLYVASNDDAFTNGSVLRYDGTSGAFVDVFVPPGSGGLSVATMMVFRAGVALSSPGLYNITSNGGQAIEHTNAGGVKPFALLPGAYRAHIPYSSTTAAFDFTLDADGLVDFAGTLDTYVSGRGTSTLTIGGLPITFDTTLLNPSAAYVVEAENGQVFSPTQAGGLMTARLLPGSYHFRVPWASTTTGFDFTVTINGTVDFATALDGYVAGRNSDTLEINGHEITIDTSLLQPSAAYMVTSGGAQAVGPTPAGTPRIVRLMPGAYRFHVPYASATAAFDFQVTSTGTVSVAPEAAGYASASGSTLTVSGYPIIINTNALQSAASYVVASDGAVAVGPTAAGTTVTVRLLPGSYRFHVPYASATAAFDFTVSTTGMVGIPPEVTGYVSATGNTLTVSGHPIAINTNAFDNEATYVVVSDGAQAVGPTAAGSTTTVRLLPGNYRFHLPYASGSAAFDFTVSVKGTIGLAPELSGFVSGADTTTLTVSGHAITIDTTALGSSSTYSMWSDGALAVGATSTGSATTVRLLPGNYLFDGPFDFNFSVLANGTIDFSAAFDPDLEGRGTSTLTVNNDPNTDADDSIVVTTTANAGAGSLRQAILAANAHPGADTITFNIGTVAPHSIALTSPLPWITDPVVIDGRTQPGYAGMPLVEINGSAAGNTAGLLFTSTAPGSVVRSLAINRISGSAIYIQDADNVEVYGNFLGVSLSGNNAIGALGNAVEIRFANGTIVGGTGAGERNVMGGGSGSGVSMLDSDNTTIVNNHIGVGFDGVSDVGFNGNGVRADGTATGNRIGLPGAGNVISGNFLYGIALFSNGSQTVQGNKVGTNAAGTAALKNQGGIGVWGSSSSGLIGGTAAGAGNLSSGNDEYGVAITSGASNIVVQGNRIGTNFAGDGAIPNAHGVLVAGTNHTIGGSVVGASNLVSGNSGKGIYVVGPGTTGNVIEGNIIGLGLNGTGSLSNGTYGVDISKASNNRLGGPLLGQGNLISRNGSSGVLITSAGGSANNNLVQGNYIGTDKNGTQARPNGAHGIEVTAFSGSANANIIGGTGPTEGNLISGNLSTGVLVAGAAASGNVVAGNRIGTRADGLSALRNEASGVEIQSAPNTVIGGTTALAKNLISGNGGAGILMSSAPGVAIRANWIGPGGNGNSALPNALGGVLVSGGSGTIGGDNATTRNLISGNTTAPGVWVMSGEAVFIEGNYIGLNAAGDAALGNLVGVRIDGVSTNIGVGDTPAGQGNVISGNGVGVLAQGGSNNRIENNLIGTDATGVDGVPNALLGIHFSNVAGTPTNYTVAGNLIAFNADAGIRIDGNASRINIASRIHSNGGLGINLAGGVEDANGVTANDLTFVDGDPGPNGLQNYPFNVTAKNEGGSTRVTGTLESTVGTFTVRVFRTGSCDPSGFGEGESVAGSFLVTTFAPTGTGTFDELLPFETPVGHAITMTATDAAGNTSEFSQCAIVSNVDVTSTSESGPGTLRNAIITANGAAGTQAITFHISGAGPHVIQPTTPLPAVTGVTVIDGTTQPGFAGVPLVVLDGSAMPPNSNGLLLQPPSAGSTIRALALGGFSSPAFTGGRAIYLRGDGNQIKGNYIGISSDGVTALPNYTGVYAESDNNDIGCTTAADRNVISGNSQGIWMPLGGSANTIHGNYIGLNAAGTAAVANQFGVLIDGSPLGTSHNVIGGLATSDRNVISGNQVGVQLRGGNFTRIQSNYIGTNAAGTAAVPNTAAGISIHSEFGNHPTATLIGSLGAFPAGGNLISGNMLEGIAVASAAVSTTIANNTIGRSATDAPLANGGRGIRLVNAIGFDIESNVISANTLAGISVEGTADQAKILKNAIYDNGRLGIDLVGGTEDANGVTAIDYGTPPDADTGPNGFQNQPVLNSVVSGGGGNTHIDVTLDSTPNTTFTIDVYESPTCDASGSGEGKLWRGSVSVPTNSEGFVLAGFFVPGLTASGQAMTVTATDAAGRSSEFSRCVFVDLDVTSTADAGPGTLRNAIAVSNATAGTQTITFHIGGPGPHTITPASALPALTDPVIIDGTTQPGFAGAPLVAISGAAVPAATGLKFTSTTTGSAVRGLAIYGFSSSDAIALFGGNTVVEGNYLGLNLAGTGAVANLRGIRIESSDNHIGGTTASQRNVISGNNIGIGVIGGVGNTIVGNYLGTSAAGTAAVPNGAGIQILVPGTIVGGFVANEGNLISGNSGSGILVGTGVSDAFIRMNVIGRSATDLPLGNGAHGIRVLNATGAYMAANTISANGQDGISVEGTSTGAFVDGNSIYGNGGLGVDLGNDGVTANDAGDGDTGPNNRQNYPVLTGAVGFPDALVVDGNLNSTALKAFQIFVYWSPACDGEGQVFVGDHIVSTNASGNAAFSIVVPPAPAPGGFVTTIAASSARDSSEFSACVAVSAP